MHCEQWRCEQACRQADRGRPGAAVLGKEGEQGVHGGIDRGVDEGSPFPRERHQPRIFQFLEVESESGGGQPKFLADLAGREAILASLDQQPIDIEAGFLGEGSQGCNGFLFLHISTLLEQ